MTDDQLTILAERVEGVEGPDFDLDCAIAVASGQYIREKRGRDRQEWYYPVAQTYGRRSVAPFGLDRLPRYTASLDAALTLVPEGFDWIIGRTNGGPTVYAEVGGTGGDYTRFAATPALALCAAALRARATVTEGGL